MGLLDQLWDDTLAGPRPDTGLGRLRRAATALNSSDVEESVRRLKETRPVTQSITIVKPRSVYQRSLSVNVDNSSSSVVSEPSIPSSPVSACSTPTSPSSSTPRDNIWRTIKAGPANANANANANPNAKKRPKAEPRAPTVYDWVVITALDR